VKKSAITALLFIFSFFSLSPIMVPYVLGAEDSWTTLEPMPTAETGLGAAVVNGKIYAVGKEVNYEYDTVADTWTPKTSMPTPRTGFGIAVYQDRIYVIGGGYGVYPNRTVTGVNEVYDPATDTWETRVLMPTNRSSMCANVVDGKIYLIGGRTGEQYSTVDLNQVYDTETDTWTTKEAIPYAVVGYASVVVDEKIYVIGGQAEFDPRMNIDNTQIYDTETDTWSQGTRIPTATLAAGAAATNGELAPERIYVMGGDGGSEKICFYACSSATLLCCFGFASTNRSSESRRYGIYQSRWKY
jgi:N-acetylneuraminic acid mutarotase